MPPRPATHAARTAIASPRPSARLASRWLLLAPAVVVALAVAIPQGARARPGDPSAPPATASAAASSAPAAAALDDAGAPEAAPAEPREPVDDEVRNLRKLASNIRALLAGELDVGTDPATLFDQKLDDAAGIAVEAARLRLIVEAADRCLRAARGDAGADGGVEEPRLVECDDLSRARATADADVAVDAGPPDDAGVGDAGAPDGAPAAASEPDEPDEPDEARLRARLEVDRARLAFYQRSATGRARLIEDHAQRQKQDAAAQAEQQLSEAERKAKEADEEQKRALEAARRARSEAARVVAEEKVRLLGLKKRHAEVEGDLIRREQALRERKESILGWRRKVAAVVDALRETGRPDTDGADRLRGEVYAALAEVRQELETALGAIGGHSSDVPATGANPLDELTVDVDRTAVDELRQKIEESERTLRAREAKLRWDRAETLLNELETLSAHRLTLLPHLSAPRRSAVTGFGPEGRSVARAEASQVWLVLRYHLLATERFITEVRTESSGMRGSALVAAWTALKWLLPIGVFVWWRRRAPRWLERWRERADEDSRTRGRGKGSSRAAKVASFLIRVRVPLEWLVLVWAVLALLPGGVRSLLEIEILWTIAAWSLGGLLVVDVIDALFATGEHVRATGLQTAHLRLRSLRWIGRAVVGFGLVLALTAKLVGQGTIFSWVWSTCWWAALPIGLVIVKWWRPVIFERIGLLRRKGVVATWVDGQTDTWGSYPAALVGGVYLLGWGVTRRVRSFVGRFDTTRKALAYLFRREMAKQAERRAEAGLAAKHYQPLDDDKYQALSPAKPSTELVASVADKQVEEVIARIGEPGGGVFALVGERGGGKSTLLTRIRDRTDDTTLTRCPLEGIAEFHRELRRDLALAEDASVEEVRAALDKGEGDNAMLIDDAHRLVHPVIGGLEELDALLELARVSSSSCTWVFAFDAVIWQYVERAREARPLFDDVILLRPWSEEGIVGLLESRSELVGIEPRFDDLISELPEGADEIDREEARQRTRANFYRLLWDYARGNPGVALHFWRRSLRSDDDGSEVVQMFRAPNASELDRLPDSSVFVLRAIIQLEWATAEDIVAATLVSRSSVEDALRFCLARGYLERDGDRCRVRWDWFRAVTLFLERRHLLVGKGA